MTAPTAIDPPLLVTANDVMVAVRNEDITWKLTGRSISYRYWSDLHTYRTLTAKERQHMATLVDSGKVRRVDAAGYKFAKRGPAVPADKAEAW